MSISTVQKLQQELNSLLGLLIINLLCSGLVLAFGVYFLMPNLIQMATTLTIQLDQIGLAILGALAFAIAIRWLVSTAEMLDIQDELKTDLRSSNEKNTLTDETLTAFIVKMTAAYRENKPTLKRMMTISKIACVLFALGASVAVVGAILGAIAGTPLWNTSLMLVNAAICYGVAAAAYVIPHFFGKYSAVWDIRLDSAEKAEVQLQNMLGET
ncbi:MAG: hypothetical protein ACM3JE_00555 [Betaproteobacteria bacterium]